jgi:hypothetical protein
MERRLRFVLVFDPWQLAFCYHFETHRYTGDRRVHDRCSGSYRSGPVQEAALEVAGDLDRDAKGAAGIGHFRELHDMDENAVEEVEGGFPVHSGNGGARGPFAYWEVGHSQPIGRWDPYRQNHLPGPVVKPASGLGTFACPIHGSLQTVANRRVEQGVVGSGSMDVATRQ